MELAAGLIGARLLHYAAVTLLFGASLFPFYAFPRGVRPPWRIERLLAGLTGASAALALVSGVLWLALATASMAGRLSAALDPAALTTAIGETEFGQVWIARLVLAAALASLVLARPGLRVVMPPAAALLATLALTGHPRTAGGEASLLLMSADAAHLLAAGAWLGALVPLAALACPPRAAGDLEPPALAALLARFSAVGALAVAILAVSGLVNALFLVGRPEALATTLYGQVLSAKLALFAAMLAIAAVNRFWITKALARGPADPGPWIARLRRRILAEQALGALVLALVAVLGTLPPASG